MLNKLIEFITQKIKLDEADIALCKTYFEPLSLTKNTIAEEQDKIPQFL